MGDNTSNNIAVPSAPAISQQDEFVENQPHSPNHSDVDPNLYRDLIHRAQGDQGLLAQWCLELGIPPPPPFQNTVAQQIAAPPNLPLPPPPSQSTPLIRGSSPLQDIEQSALELGAPQSFFCPICMHLMRDPVLLPTGQTYERSAIETWLARGRNTCPVTGQILATPIKVTPNFALRQLIEEWVGQHAPWMLGEDGRIQPAEDLLPPQSATIDVNNRDILVDTALASSLQHQEMQRAMEQQHQSSANSPARQSINRYAYNYVDKRCTEWVFNFITLVYVVLVVLAFIFNEWNVEPLVRNPLVGVSAKTVLKIGGTDYEKVYEQHEYWRLISSIWINVGLIHIISTVGVMWVCIQHLGIVMQWNALLLIYISSALAGSIGSTLMAQESVSACGTAGAVGLLGALVAEHLVDWRLYKNHVATFVVAIVLGASVAFINLAPMLDNWGNLCAFVAGSLLTVAVLFADRQRVRRFKGLKIALAILCFISLVMLLLVGILALLFGTSPIENCDWCSNLTCPATDWWQCEAAAANPQDCVFGFGVSGENTTQITCPTGYQGIVTITNSDENTLNLLCQELCSLVRNDFDVGSGGQIGSSGAGENGPSQGDVLYI